MVLLLTVFQAIRELARQLETGYVGDKPRASKGTDVGFGGDWLMGKLEKGVGCANRLRLEADNA